MYIRDNNGNLRCGLPDALVTSNAKKIRKWGIRDLKYFIKRSDSDMPDSIWHQEIRAAMDSWEAVTNVKFIRCENPNEANIIIDIGQGEQDSFDGKGGTLAWAYLPPNSSYNGQLLMKFDIAEFWITSPEKAGVLLQNVAAHELGHILGLTHSEINTALMAPYYNKDVAVPQENDDGIRIRELYGHPVVAKQTNGLGLDLDGRYSLDWHLGRLAWDNFQHHVKEYKGKPIKILEIGCLEGQSTEWFIKNVLTHKNSKIVCVDPFINPLCKHGEKERLFNDKTIEEMFHENIIKKFPLKVEYHKQKSQDFLRSHCGKNCFDIIYIDGDHESKSVLEDMVLAWPKLKSGGIMLLDDYGMGGETPFHRKPIAAINSFMSCYDGDYKVEYIGYFVCLRKV